MSNPTGNQSLPLSEAPRQVLAEIVSRYGPTVCETPSQVEGLLRDMCGEYRREINLLVTALKDKVAADLLSASMSPAELLIGRLTTRLRDNHSLTDEAARWAVESWALALGRTSREQLSAPPPAVSLAPPAPPRAACSRIASIWWVISGPRDGSVCRAGTKSGADAACAYHLAAACLWTASGDAKYLRYSGASSAGSYVDGLELGGFLLELALDVQQRCCRRPSSPADFVLHSLRQHYQRHLSRGQRK